MAKIDGVFSLAVVWKNDRHIIFTSVGNKEKKVLINSLNVD